MLKIEQMVHALVWSGTGQFYSKFLGLFHWHWGNQWWSNHQHGYSCLPLGQISVSRNDLKCKHYRQISNIRRIKSQNLNVSRLVLQLSQSTEARVNGLTCGRMVCTCVVPAGLGDACCCTAAACCCGCCCCCCCCCCCWARAAKIYKTTKVT